MTTYIYWVFLPVLLHAYISEDCTIIVLPFRWGNWGVEMLSNLPEVMQLLSVRAWFWTRRPHSSPNCQSLNLRTIKADTGHWPLELTGLARGPVFNPDQTRWTLGPSSIQPANSALLKIQKRRLRCRNCLARISWEFTSQIPNHLVCELSGHAFGL